MMTPLSGVLFVILAWIISVLARAYKTYIRQREGSRLCSYKKRKIQIDQDISFAKVVKETVFQNSHINEKIFELYKKHEGKPYVGFYAAGSPRILIRDTNLIKGILVDDFSHFQEKTSTTLLAVPNKRTVDFMFPSPAHNTLRPFLTAYLNSDFFLDNVLIKARHTAEQLCADIKQKILADELQIDLSELIADYAANSTARCILDKEIEKCKTRLFPVSLCQKLLFFLPGTKEPDIRFTDFRWLEYLKKYTVIKTGIRNLFNFLMKYRDHDLSYTKDLDYLLLDEYINNKKGQRIMTPIVKITDKLIISQSFISCLKGFEGCRSVISYTLLELGRHKTVQRKLQDEIDETLGLNESFVTVKELLEMRYLDMILSEVLRLHPPITTITRKCLRHYSSFGNRLKLQAGDEIVISVRGLHLDGNFWDKPSHFDPDRFNVDDPEDRPLCSYLPFGLGSRRCVGSLMAKTQSMVAIFCIMKEFEVSSESWKDAKSPGHWRHPVDCLLTIKPRTRKTLQNNNLKNGNSK